MIEPTVRKKIKDLLRLKLKDKLAKYDPEGSTMPFHWALIGKERVEIFSFIQSINTSLGQSIFEQIAKLLVEGHSVFSQNQYKIGTEIYKESQDAITLILNSLETGVAIPDQVSEHKLIRNSLKGEKIERKFTKVDVYFETNNGHAFCIDIKTAKSNKGEFRGLKKNLLDWYAAAQITKPGLEYHTILGIPYNPYQPAPYARWTHTGIIDLKEDLLVGKDLWDFLGGDGTYEDLMAIFDEIGIEMKDEIDEYFTRFKV